MFLYLIFNLKTLILFLGLNSQPISRIRNHIDLFSEDRAQRLCVFTVYFYSNLQVCGFNVFISNLHLSNLKILYANCKIPFFQLQGYDGRIPQWNFAHGVLAHFKPTFVSIGTLPSLSCWILTKKCKSLCFQHFTSVFFLIGINFTYWQLNVNRIVKTRNVVKLPFQIQISLCEDHVKKNKPSLKETLVKWRSKALNNAREGKWEVECSQPMT